MKSDTIKPVNTLRLKDVRLLEKLQEMYDMTKFESVNEFLNAVLKSYAFKENRDDQIIELLDQIEDTTTAIWEKVKDDKRTTN
ncbi:hypothetical protein IJD15_01905 [bacterium]|nr:hypothetical protein [Clostridia bacterium]MBQ4077919.1 hypothetical protein [bacterium]